MDNRTERGMALRELGTDDPDDLWRKACKLADAIKVCIDRHSEMLKTDPEYREALDYLRSCCPRPGQLGQMIRMGVGWQHALDQGAVTRPGT